MVGPKGAVLWCEILVFALKYLSCFSATSYGATTAAQWTLYSGLKLSWNEASMFCKSLGGHLPVVNTKLKWNGFNATIVNWHKANMLLDDVWTGLFTQPLSTKPATWEADCSLQPDGLDFWGPFEPNDINTDLCVRYHLLTQKLHTMICSNLYNIVCEFGQGSCRSTRGSLLGTLLQGTGLIVSTADSCWSKCLNYPPTASGQECIGATFTWLGLCTPYLGDTLQFTTSPSSNLLATTIVKECFQNNVIHLCSNYTFVDNSSSPRPVGDPCSSSQTSFVPEVPISINSTCIHTSTAASSQASLLEISSAPTTKQQSSDTSRTETTWPTMTMMSPARNSSLGNASTMPVNSSTHSIISSTVGVTDSTRTINSSTLPSTINSSTLPFTSSTKPVTTGLMSSVWWTVQSSKELTTKKDNSTALRQETTATTLTLPHTDPVSDLTKYVSTSGESLSPIGFQPLLCSCMISFPNTSARFENTIIHRNITSKYRRSHNSEWGSPSVYTSTSSATFVIVVGVVGFLFVVCDINRWTSLLDKKRRETIEISSEEHI